MATDMMGTSGFKISLLSSSFLNSAVKALLKLAYIL